MKDKILRLCKRLKQFSLNEVTTITELDQEDVKYILDELVSENNIIETNGLYKYNEKLTAKQTPRIFQYYDSNVIDLIIRCFCSSIPSHKACKIVNISDDSILKFYDIFRNIIYEFNKKQLEKFYKNNPQICRNRIFFEQEVHFYIYNKQVYVTDKIFISETKEKEYTKKEIIEFKKVYSYLTRSEFHHNKNKHNLVSKLTEYIWRRNKDFDELYSDLNNLLNISYKRLTNFS